MILKKYDIKENDIKENDIKELAPGAYKVCFHTINRLRLIENGFALPEQQRSYKIDPRLRVNLSRPED
jgi:hypothetical protein